MITQDGRRVGICWGKRPRCVDGHNLHPRDLIITNGVTTCRHKIAANHAHCGRRLYLHKLPLLNGWLVVEVSEAQVSELNKRGHEMAFLDIAHLLGITLPNVALDLPEARSHQENQHG